MKNNKTIAVFCGSKFGNNASIKNEVKKAIETIVKQALASNATILCGFNKGRQEESKSFMAHLFQVCQEQGCPVQTVPFNLQNQLEQRYTLLNNASIFIALPGGTGTMAEINDVLLKITLNINQNKTPSQLIIFNTSGFFNGVTEQLETIINLGFVSKAAIAKTLNYVKIINNVGALQSSLKSILK